LFMQLISPSPISQDLQVLITKMSYHILITNSSKPLAENVCNKYVYFLRNFKIHPLQKISIPCIILESGHLSNGCRSNMTCAVRNTF
jgi:hypothetical protein